MHPQSETLAAGENVHGLTSPARVFRSWILRKLAALPETVVVVRDAMGEVECRNPQFADAKRLIITVVNPAVYQRVAFLGLNGAVSAYIEGMWSVSNVGLLLKALMASPDAWRGLNGGLQRLPQPIARVAGNLIPLVGVERQPPVELYLSQLSQYLDSLVEAEVDESLSLTSLRTIWESVRSLGLLRVRSFDHVLVTHALGSASALKVGGDYGATVTALVATADQQLRFRRNIQSKGLEKQVVARCGSIGKIRSRYSRILTQVMLAENHATFWENYIHQLDRILTDDGVAVIETICRTPQKSDSPGSGGNPSERRLTKAFAPLSISEMVSLLVDEHHMQILFMEDFTDTFENAVRDARKMLTSPLSLETEPVPEPHLMRSWELTMAISEAAIQADRIRAVRLVIQR